MSLREWQYMLLAEEVLSSPHQTFVHACVQPSASISDISSMSTSRSSSLAPSRQLPAEDLPGSLTTGGYTFFLATLVKVINIAQTPKGVRLRVQAEGRLAVKSLTTLQPYFKALVVPLTDSVCLDDVTAPAWERTYALYRELKTLAQEVQTLTQRMAASSSTHPLSAPQLKAAADALSWSDYRHPLMYNSASTLLNSGPGDRDCPSKVRSMSGYGSWGSRSSSGSSSGSTSSMDDPLVQGNGLPTLLELEKACRLSFAALHSLPQGNLQEQEAAVALAAAAMSSQDLDGRLQRAALALREARTSLSARLALQSVLSPS